MNAGRQRASARLYSRDSWRVPYPVMEPGRMRAAAASWNKVLYSVTLLV